MRLIGLAQQCLEFIPNSIGRNAGKMRVYIDFALSLVLLLEAVEVQIVYRRWGKLISKTLFFIKTIYCCKNDNVSSLRVRDAKFRLKVLEIETN